MSEDRLVDIEVRLAHQDQLLIDLDRIVTDQQARIMALESRVTTLTDFVRAIGGGQTDAPHDDKPPHY